MCALKDIRANDCSTVREGQSSAQDVGFYLKCNGKPLQEAELVNFVTGLKF